MPDVLDVLEMDIMAGQQGLGGDQMPRFNAELDTDTDSMGGRMPKMRTVGPGIEARIKLLFNCDDMDKVDREEKKQCEVLMNKQEVTTIKRKKRTGQRREEGVRVIKLDSWLNKKENPKSQLAGKRKLCDGEVSDCKRRIFGSK